MELLLREIAAHMATTPPAALAPLLWGVGMLLVLRRVRRHEPVAPRPAASRTAPGADDVRSAA